MRKSEIQALVAIAVILLVAAGIAFAGSQGGAEVAGLPVFALCGLIAFGVNWLVFVHAWLARTEHFFDLTGSLTYISLVLVALGTTGTEDGRSLLIGLCVLVWALRLGPFLFLRVRRDGGDGRFDALKQSFPRFLMTWTLQGLWVYLTLAAGLAAMTAADSVPFGLVGAIGLLLWLVGFVVETVADAQKTAFRRDPDNQGRFITSGLWAWSRHPNYFGEITLWLGIAVMAAPVLVGWQWLTMISPVFVYVLLTRISGIPLLEARGRKRWGEDPEYQAYLERTPQLFPRPPR